MALTHGPHQVPQNSRTTALPLSFSNVCGESVGACSSFSKCMGGAGLANAGGDLSSADFFSTGGSANDGLNGTKKARAKVAAIRTKRRSPMTVPRRQWEIDRPYSMVART